jgi:alpha-tubulin suppressor-like RCC1 family protein
VFGFGRNSDGQLGLGHFNQHLTPQLVTLANTQSGYPLSLCASWRFSCVLDSKNNLACTGGDSYGEQGVGAFSSNSKTLAAPTGVSSVAHIGCGHNFVLATTTTGALRCGVSTRTDN